MTAINNIEKISKELRKGDKKKIAEMSNVHSWTVGRALKGDEKISEETTLRIIKNAAKVIASRNKVVATAENIINSI